MARKRKSPKPEAKVTVDPNAQVFQVGDEIVVIRPNLIWQGYSGVVESMDGGMCRVRIMPSQAFRGMSFPADIPASELKLDL